MTEGLPCNDIINLCPYPVVAVDNQQTVKMANSAFTSLTGVNDHRLIGATADSEAIPVLNVLLGNSSIIQLNAPNQQTVALQRTSRTLSVNNGENLHLHYFHVLNTADALQQENLRLKQQVERLTLTDDLTGLANERALSQQLAIQVARSRRYQNPLTLALLNMEIVDEDYPHILDDHYNSIIIAFSHFLRDRLRWADFIARCSGGRFVIVLPETTAEEANRLFEKIASEMHGIELPDKQKNCIKMQFGLAEWQKGNDPKLLVERASMALNKPA